MTSLSVLGALDLVAMTLAGSLAYSVALGLHGIFGEGTFVGAWNVLWDRATTFAAIACCAALWFAAHGHYRSNKTFWDEAKEVFVVCMFCLMAEGFLHFAQKGEMSRLLTVSTWLLAPFAIMPMRRLGKAVLRRFGVGSTRIIVFGDPEEARAATEALTADAHLGYEVVAVLPVDAPDPILRFREAEADAGVVALSENAGPGNAVASELARAGIPLVIVPPVSGVPVAGMQAQYIIGKDTVLLVDRNGFGNPFSGAAKRGFDATVAAFLLSVAAIPMIVVALAVASDGGDPIFGHERVGRDGRRFRCLKFRTMVKDSPAVLERHLASDPAAREEWDRDRKLKSDPRVTGFGSFLRKTALDELPQLINVVRGDMSLVGPRPVTEAEIERYGNSKMLYQSVRPGITGLWQVSGRNDLSYEQRVSLDAWYVRNWSVWNDVAILARTVPAVLARRGAY